MFFSSGHSRDSKNKGGLIMAKAEDSIVVMEMLMLRTVRNYLDLFTFSAKQNVSFYCKTKKGVWNPDILE